MDNKERKSIITEQLDKITERTKNINASLSQLDIDLILQDIRKLYDHCCSLQAFPAENVVRDAHTPEGSADSEDDEKSSTEQHAVTSPASPETNEKEEKFPAHDEHIQTNSEATGPDKTGSAKDGGDKTGHDDKQMKGDALPGEQENITADIPHKPKETQSKEDAPQPAITGTLNLFDEGHAEARPEAEKATPIGEKDTENPIDIADRMRHTSIGNIKEAIGINQKFLFINALFDGDMEQYNRAIQKLDAMAGFEEAQQELERLGKENRWDTESDACQQFFGLVERRYL